MLGVSISAITGNESAMEKAKQARTENEAGGELDSIKLAVVSAMSKGTYGMVEGANLANALTGTILDATDDADQLTAIRSNENGPTWDVEKNGKVYEISQNGNVEVFSGLILSPKNLTLTIQGDTFEEKTVTARLIGIEGTLTWSESTSKIQITPSADNMSATIKALAVGTETITVTCSNGDTAECTVTVRKMLENAIDLGTDINGSGVTTDDWVLLYDGTGSTAETIGGYIYCILADYLPNTYKVNSTDTKSVVETAGLTKVAGRAYNVYIPTGSGNASTLITALNHSTAWTPLISSTYSGISGVTVRGSLPRAEMNKIKAARTKTDYYLAESKGDYSAHGCYGYWLASPYSSSNISAYYVYYDGSVAYTRSFWREVWGLPNS